MGKKNNGALPVDEPLAINFDDQERVIANLWATQNSQAVKLWEHEQLLEEISSKQDEMLRLLTKQDRVSSAQRQVLHNLATGFLALEDLIDEAK